MNMHPRSAQSRLAAIVLLVIAVILATAVFAVPTLWLHKRYDAYLDDFTDRLQRYRRVASLRPAIEAATTEVLKRDGGKFYSHASSNNLAAAELQSLVTRIIERHQGRVASSQIKAEKEDSKEGAPPKVSIFVQFSASIIPLQVILHAIETNTPYLFIEKATLTSRYGRTYKPDPGLQPELSIQLTISGYMLSAGAQP